jgi:hypothetical protein
MGVLSNVNEPGRLSDLIAANLRLKMEEAQEILQCIDPMDRLRLIITHLVHESEVATMQIKIQTSAREGMDKAQKEYYLREQLKAIRKELGDGPDADEFKAIASSLGCASRIEFAGYQTGGALQAYVERTCRIRSSRLSLPARLSSARISAESPSWSMKGKRGSFASPGMSRRWRMPSRAVRARSWIGPLTRCCSATAAPTSWKTARVRSL